MSFTNADKIARIQELQDHHHDFLPPEACDYFTEPFGFKATTYTARNTRGPKNPKGLLLPEGMTKMEGRDGPELALQIARHLGLSPPTWQSGRGFRMRTFCGAILAHLEKESGCSPTS